MQDTARMRPRQIGITSIRTIACLVLSEWLILLSHSTRTEQSRPSPVSWKTKTNQYFPLEVWSHHGVTRRLRGGAPRRTTRSRASSRDSGKGVDEQSDSFLPDASQSSLDSGASADAIGTRRSSRNRTSRSGSSRDSTTPKPRSSSIKLQSSLVPGAASVRFSGASEQTPGDVTPADRGSRVSFRDFTESGRKLEAETPTREVFTYTPESIAKGRRNRDDDGGERMEGTPVLKGRRRRARKVQLTPLGARYAERESQSEWSEGGGSVDRGLGDSDMHSSDSVAFRTRSRAVSEASMSDADGEGSAQSQSKSELEPSSWQHSHESSWSGAAEHSLADDAVQDPPVAPSAHRPKHSLSSVPGTYEACAATRQSSAKEQIAPVLPPIRLCRCLASSGTDAGSRARRKYTGEAVVYDGGWLVPHKDNWQVPCDIVGCDGKACKAWARKQQRDAKLVIGDRVRTNDGPGTVIDKDSSARPLRVRLDATEEEGWYTMKEVRKTFLKKRDDTLLSASAFGLSVHAQKEMSQSGAADISASSHPGNPDAVRAETIPEYAKSSAEEARRGAYGPYKDTMRDQETLKELEERLGIEDLQIRMWPMVLRSENETENEVLRKECWLDPEIVGIADSDRARAGSRQRPPTTETPDDDMPPFLQGMAKHLVENEELVVQPLEQEIMTALDLTAQEAKHAADIFRKFVGASRALRMSNVNKLVSWILGDRARFRPIEVQEARVCQAVCTLLPHWVLLPADVEPHVVSADAGREQNPASDIDPGSAKDDSGSEGRGALSAKQVRRQLFWDEDSEAAQLGSGAKRAPAGYQGRRKSYNGTYSKIGTMPGFGDPVLLRDDWTFKEGDENEWDREPKTIAVSEIVDILKAVAEADDVPPGKAESDDGPFFECMSWDDVQGRKNASYQPEGVGMEGDSDGVESSSAGPSVRRDKRPGRASDSGTESETGAGAKRRKTRRGVAAKFDYAKAFAGLDGPAPTDGTRDSSFSGRAEQILPAVGRRIALVGGFNGQDYLDSVDALDIDIGMRTARVSSLQDHTWGFAQCGSRRGFLASVHCQDRIYAIGGFDPAPSGMRCDVVESFDVAKWTRRLEPSLTQPRSWHAAASTGGSIMVVGGNNGTHHTSSAEILRVQASGAAARVGWTAVQPMGYRRYAPAACCLGGRCVAAGGYGDWEGSRKRNMEMLTSVESYDFGEDRWLPLPALLYPNSRFGLVEARGRMYAVGGFDGDHALNSVISYDPRMKLWTAEPSLCVRRSYASTVVVGDCIYALGGFNGELFSDTVEMWDTRAAAWTPCSKLPHARAYMGAAVF